MRIASRDRLISIVRDVESGRNAFNEAVTAPQTVATVRAAKRGVSAREFLSAERVAAEERATFNIRWRGDLLPTDRVVCDGRTFNIEGFREIGRRRELEIQATAAS
jgi:SPP1 family predicted phage head-tail adaptor